MIIILTFYVKSKHSTLKLYTELIIAPHSVTQDSLLLKQPQGIGIKFAVNLFVKCSKSLTIYLLVTVLSHQLLLVKLQWNCSLR